jgi:hypothetical protein
MNRRANRTEIDQIAWNTIRTAEVRSTPPSGYEACGRPSNYAELGRIIVDRGGDFEHAWGEFLHEFYRYRQPSFFSIPPPRSMSPGWRAILAGTAEYLSNEFGLSVSAWTEEAEYFLPEVWDPLSDLFADIEQYEDERRTKAHEVFLKRNVIFESRNLIAL